MSEWQEPTNQYYRDRLRLTHEGKLESVLASLRSATDPRLKYPLQIVAHDHATGLRRDDLPVNPARYAQAALRVAAEPMSQAGGVLRSGYFGYNLDDGFRRIGPFNYIRLGVDVSVAEMGFGNELALTCFRYHLYGRKVTEEALRRIAQVQTAVFQYLRNHAGARQKLKEFAESRGWPAGIADEAQLAYFHEKVTPLKAWAAVQGFSDEDMYLAGWFDLQFSSSGEPCYTVRDSHVIRIPYFRQGEIETWRTRNLKVSREYTHKYTSWPLDRSVERELSIEHKLYNSWNLHQAHGEPLIITEGEFKCLIAIKQGGILTVGIPGITEVDREIIQALVAARASRYIVILDRDPVGKGLMRVDGVTDSQRAAYGIVRRLQSAGARNVVVGTIPDVRQGAKVGLDDLILDCGSTALRTVVAQACSPADYARSINLNVVFYEMWYARQRIRKALELYEYSVQRGGPQLPPAGYAEAQRLRDALDELYRDFLATRFRGAQRISQPFAQLAVNFQTRGIPQAEQKLIITKEGEGLLTEKFCDDIVFLEFFTADTPADVIWTRNAALRVPFTMRDLQQLFQSGNTDDAAVWQCVTTGMEALGREYRRGDRPWASLADLGTVLLAGRLVQWFPPDEYAYRPEVLLCLRYDTYWEQLVRVPIMIFRKGHGMAVAFAGLPTWHDRDDLAFALDVSHQVFNLSSWFFRHISATHAIDKYQMVAETLWPYWFERNRLATVAVMAGLGVPEPVVDRYHLLAIAPEDVEELMKHFAHRRLLNQATHVGVFRRDTSGRIVARFQAQFVLMPLREEGTVRALRVLPLAVEDHLPPALSPCPKLVRHLYGAGRHLVADLNPERHLYLQDCLAKTTGRTLLVAFHELDGLVLAAANEHVVALNSSFAVHPDVIARLAVSDPAQVCFVISGTPPASCYDNFSFDGIPGYLKEVHDLRENVRALSLGPRGHVPFLVIVVPTPLTHLGRHPAVVDLGAESLLKIAVPLDDYLTSKRFNASAHQIVRQFFKVSSRLLDYLEVAALPDLLDGKPIDWWIRESKRQYAAVAGYVKSKHNGEMAPVEQYFQQQLGLPEPLPLEELVRQRRKEGKIFVHRPVYSHGAEDVPQPGMTILEPFRAQFDAIMQAWPDPTPRLENSLLAAPSVPLGTPVPVPSGSESTNDNPKGRVLEVLQQRGAAVERPVASYLPAADQFTCSVTLSFQGQNVSGSGQGRTKKAAEAQAYREILAQIAPAAAQPESPERRQAARIQQALQLPAGNKNFVGCLHGVCQVAGWQPPQFISTPRIEEQGTTWVTWVKIALPGGEELQSGEFQFDAKQEGRQCAAYDLLAKIAVHIS